MCKNQATRALLRLQLLFTLAILCVCNAWAKRTDDVVILRNGDRLTGEIKSLQRGELKFKASYMAEAVRLDWTKVYRLESKDSFLIYLTDGQLFTGSLDMNATKPDVTGTFVIEVDNGITKVDQLEVARIMPIEARFFKQLEGTVDLGFSFTSGNDQYQTQFSSSVTYRKGDHSLTGSVESAFSGQRQGSSSARNQFTFDYRKQLSPKWYVGGLFDYLKSDQQSLEHRITLGGLVGRNMRQTERTRFSVFGGLVGTRERYADELGQPRSGNADALAGFDFATFRFKTTDIRSRFSSFPSLTTPGRMRIQATSDLRIEVFKDLYWGFHVYENFDSKPPVPADKNDLGVSTSIGWKF